MKIYLQTQYKPLQILKCHDSCIQYILNMCLSQITYVLKSMNN